MPLQSTILTTFRLILYLLQPKKKIITKSYQLQVGEALHDYQHQRYVNESNMSVVVKKKNKKKKPNLRIEQPVHYPRTSINIQEWESELNQKQMIRLKKCEYVGRQISGLHGYFIADMITKNDYNGNYGNYTIQILIPGAVYSTLSIDIIINDLYPFQLPCVNVDTRNLHPLEKQKLKQIQQEHVGIFEMIKGNTNENEKESEDWKQKYFGVYYPYILNLCISISQQLFYRPDYILSLEQNLNPKEQKVSVHQEKRIKLQANKEIYQSILQEIFNQYEIDNHDIDLNKQFQYNIPKHPNMRGRYKADYEELEMVGQGGFGSVYRCKNRIDSNIYAVKKIIINYNDPQSRKLLKQVALLSKLNHPNIVRYHQSWLEDTSSVDELIADMSISDVEEIEQFNKIWKQYSIQHGGKDFSEESQQGERSESGQDRSRRERAMKEQDSVIFGDDIIFEADYSSYGDYNESKRSQQQSKNRYDEDSESNTSSGIQPKLEYRKHSQIYEFPFKILYIVMQFCGSMTLKDFITKRFNEPSDVKIKLIRGILQGLAYIHSKRIMHRDLKPANIFLIDGSNKVKIGDFGLATIGSIENNPYEAEIMEYSEKTKGVGTSFYRAPEQFHSSQYDQKIDIYSLGIIMLQLFYQFGTNMERYEVLTEVTKNHRLPKDFNKKDNNSEFQKHIQSCMSVRPQDRPNVKTLLEAFRDKYFSLLVSLIANPKHFQFSQLLEHLFQINNETNMLMKQNLYKNYLTYEFTKIYQIHRGVLFIPLSFVPVIDYDTLNGMKIAASRKEKFLLLSEKGVVMEFPPNAYVSWMRYAKETMKRNYKIDSPVNYNNYWKLEYSEQNKEMRRFTFQKVVEFTGGDSKTEFSFKEKYVTAFDIAYSLEGGTQMHYFLCEALKISELMIETMNLTQKNPPIYLCHSFIYKCLALECSIANININKFLLSTSDDKFRTMKNQSKMEYMNKFGLEGFIVRRLLNLMQQEFDDENEFINSFKMTLFQKEKGDKAQELKSLYSKIQQEIKEVVEKFKIFGLAEKIRWKLQIPSSNTCGFFWNVGPIRGFTGVDQFLPGQQLCNLHIETSLNPSSEQNQADVSVWSNGQFLEKDIMEVIAKCWTKNISTKWYDQSVGEKDLSCRHNIILKKRNDRVYMMFRKNHVGFDRILQKKLSRQDELKDEKESSFILKQQFNYEALKNSIRDTNRKMFSLH